MTDSDKLIDIEMLEQHLAALEQKEITLREQEGRFIKMQGIEERIEAARMDAGTIETEISGMKEELAELKAKKGMIVSSSLKPMIDVLNESLTEGEADISVNGNVLVGWKRGGVTVPYNGLSGGEKVIFNGALCHALRADIIFYESAEADSEAIEALLKRLDKIDGPQVIVNTCHMPEQLGYVVPESFKIVRL